MSTVKPKAARRSTRSKLQPPKPAAGQPPSECLTPIPSDGLWDMAMVAVGQIVPDPINENEHPPEQIAAIKLSLTKFGQTKAIVVNRRNNQIIAGNGTYACIKELSWPTVLVRWVDWSAKQQRDYRITDNRTAQMSRWNPDLLNLSLTAMQADAESADLYASLQLAQLAADFAPPPPVAEDRPSFTIPQTFAMFVECSTEAEQKALYELLKNRGYKRLRVLTVGETKALQQHTA